MCDISGKADTLTSGNKLVPRIYGEGRIQG